MTRDATAAATRAGLSSYHRMKQRAEIAEAEELRIGHLLADCRGEIARWRDKYLDAVKCQHEAVAEVGRLRLQAALRTAQPTWHHDLSTVVGGVMLAAGLIAAIVWGIYG